MRVKSLEFKYRKRDVIIKIALSLLNVYSILLDYLVNLNFLFFYYSLITLLENLRSKNNNK